MAAMGGIDIDISDKSPQQPSSKSRQCASGMGLLVVWLIRLYMIHPVSPVVVVLVLLLSLGYLLRISSGRNSEMASVVQFRHKTNRPSLNNKRDE
jgi:hypothetical protein